MTPAQHFKLGFLSSCVSQGITAEQGLERLEKFATEKQATTKTASLSSWIPGPPSIGTLATLLAAPVAVGAGGIYGAHALGESAGGAARGQQLAQPIDTKQTQKQELIAAYREQTRRIVEGLAKHQQEDQNPIKKDMTAQSLYGGY